MNLLCPNCQKPLTVPEQSAGQLMRCPLCSGTFTVPSLPQAATAATPAADPASESASPSSAPAQTGEDVFRLAPSPESPPAPPRQEAPPPSPSPEVSRPVEPAAAAPPGGEGRFTVSLNPEVVPWIAPAALGLVFLLLFLPWTGTLVWGEKPEMIWYTQSGWGTGFGSNWSGLGLLHILLVLLALPLVVAVVVVPVFGIKLPPAVERFWPWRNALVAGVVALATLFLLLQFITGFGLAKKLDTLAQAQDLEKFKNDELSKQLRTADQRTTAAEVVYRSVWAWLALLCHFVALASLGLQYWLQQRGKRPLPRLEVVW